MLSSRFIKLYIVSLNQIKNPIDLLELTIQFKFQGLSSSTANENEKYEMAHRINGFSQLMEIYR